MQQIQKEASHIKPINTRWPSSILNEFLFYSQLQLHTQLLPSVTALFASAALCPHSIPANVDQRRSPAPSLQPRDVLSRYRLLAGYLASAGAQTPASVALANAATSGRLVPLLAAAAAFSHTQAETVGVGSSPKEANINKTNSPPYPARAFLSIFPQYSTAAPRTRPATPSNRQENIRHPTFWALDSCL